MCQRLAPQIAKIGGKCGEEREENKSQQNMKKKKDGNGTSKDD